MIYIILLTINLINIFNTNLIHATGNIEIEVAGIKNHKGSILASLYNSSDGFPDDPSKAVALKEVKVENSTVILTFNDLPYGTYALILFHDENDNKKLDTNFIGIPKEGLGTSNNAKPVFRAPRYEEASFELNTNKYKAEVNLNFY